MNMHYALSSTAELGGLLNLRRRAPAEIRDVCASS
jgi:hypothetical protein